jgi:hypothetical protein
VRAVAGNAVRLRGYSQLARGTMNLVHLLPAGRSPEYLRVLGLVSWEEGGASEATALLERAERLFCQKGEPMQVLDTRRLRTLLHAELGDDAEALWLAGTTAPAVVTTRPWLGARTALTEAFCLAGRAARPSDRKEARLLLDQAMELTEAVTDEAERLYLAWLAGRARARLRRDAVAEEQLAVLVPAAAHLWPAGDLHLLLLDLCVCRTPGRQALDLQRVEAELRGAATAETVETVIEPALEAIDLLVDPSRPAWDLAADIARFLRTYARLAQPTGLRPIPFQVHWPQTAEAPRSVETH